MGVAESPTRNLSHGLMVCLLTSLLCFRLCTRQPRPQVELGIGPLGHRVTLLQGIKELADCCSGRGRGGSHTGSGSEGLALELCRHFAAHRAAATAAGVQAASRNSGGGGGGGGGYGGPPHGAPLKRPRSAPDQRARAPAARLDGGRSVREEEGACLGPAAGRMTVAEQRSKLLFELSRAQARAAARQGVAAHSGEVARIAGREVEQLAAAVRDLDRRFNAQVQPADRRRGWTKGLDGRRGLRALCSLLTTSSVFEHSGQHAAADLGFHAHVPDAG
jgi:hypothetical protein